MVMLELIALWVVIMVICVCLWVELKNKNKELEEQRKKQEDLFNELKRSGDALSEVRKSTKKHESYRGYEIIVLKEESSVPYSMFRFRGRCLIYKQKNKHMGYGNIINYYVVDFYEEEVEFLNYSLSEVKTIIDNKYLEQERLKEQEEFEKKFAKMKENKKTKKKGVKK